MWFLKKGKLKVFTDGAIRPQKQISGLAAIVWNEQGQIVHWWCRQAGPMTNNEAEYAGLLLGMELAVRQRAAASIFVLDSETVVGQMCGRFAVNSKKLRRWHGEAIERARAIRQPHYCAVPRAWNPLADALARQAGVPWTGLRAAIERRLGDY